jgi:hypothetical protein
MSRVYQERNLLHNGGEEGHLTSTYFLNFKKKGWGGLCFYIFFLEFKKQVYKKLDHI